MLPAADIAAPWFAWLAANAVMAVACALQSAVGIGMALLAVPLLALIDPHFVPGPMLLAGTLVPLAAALRERHAVDARNLGPALLGLITGTLAGALALSLLDPSGLGRVFGAMVLLAVAISLSGIRLRPTRPALVTGSGIAGLMGTMAGIHGPPVALVFQNAQPAIARAMMGAIFVPAYLMSVAALAAFGLFGLPELRLAAVLLPGTIAGILAAPLLIRRIDTRRMRLAILSISAISAIALLLK